MADYKTLNKGWGLMTRDELVSDGILKQVPLNVYTQM